MKYLAMFAALVVAFVVYAASQPNDMHVSRSATMNAPASKIFEQVNDFHKWEAWSPWSKIDPNAKTVFEGPTSGVGAIMRWDGNNSVGSGSMTITKSQPSEIITMDLEFLRPFKGSNKTEFTFKTEGNQTLVTWTMDGKKNLMTKIMGLLMNCDKIMNTQFDNGLASMKAIVEKP